MLEKKEISILIHSQVIIASSYQQDNHEYPWPWICSQTDHS